MHNRLLSALVLVALFSGHAEAAADLAKGRELAAAKCTLCHGEYGNAVNPGVPKLSGQNELYLAKQLHDFSDGKRKDAEMGIVAKKLSDEDIDNLAAWFASIVIDVHPAP